MLGKFKPVQIVISLLAGIFIGVGFVLFSYPLKNVPFFYTPLFSLAGMLLCYTVLDKSIWQPYRNLNKGRKWLSFIFIVLLSAMLTLALKGPQPHLQDSPLFLVAYTYLAVFLFFFFVQLIAIKLLYMVHTQDKQGPVPKRHILYYAALPFFISLLYFWAFYPGILVIDSVNQWQQAHANFFNDWHPVMMTWLIKLTTVFWDNPASFVILQFLLTSLITGYVLYSFEKLKINKWLLTIGLLFLSFFPLFPLYSVIIWKDTLYNYFFLLFTTMLIQIIYTKGKWLHSFMNLIGLFLSVCGVVFFRHNGWPVLLGTIVILLFFLRKKYWRMYGVFVVVVATYLIVTHPIYHYFKVYPSEPTEAYAIPIQQVGRIIKDNGQMTASQKQYFNQVFPLNEWKQTYHRAEVDPVKFSGDFHRKVIDANKKEFFVNWAAVSLQNPKLAFAAFYDEVQLAWKLYVPQQQMRPIFRYKSFNDMGPVYFLSSTNVKKYHIDYKPFHYNSYGSQNANQSLSGLIQRINQPFEKGMLRVLVMPGFYLFMAILFLFISILKGNWIYLLTAVPMFLNVGSMFAAIPAQDPRYFFTNFLLVVPYFFVATLSCRKRDAHE